MRKRAAVRKINKLIRVHDIQEDTASTIHMDTLYVLDTITIPQIKWDTLREYKLDTLYEVQKDGIRTEIIIKKDSFWIQNTVFERDTVYQKEQVIKTITNEIRVPNTPHSFAYFGNWFMNIVFIILSIILIINIIKRRITK